MFDYNNFTYRSFIDYVMKKMKLDETPEPTKSNIELEIARVLGDRILTATMQAMTEENIALFEIIQADNPEMAPFESLFAMIDQVPALHEVMIKNINDLAEEFVYDSERLDIALKEEPKK